MTDDIMLMFLNSLSESDACSFLYEGDPSLLSILESQRDYSTVLTLIDRYSIINDIVETVGKRQDEKVGFVYLLDRMCINISKYGTCKDVLMLLSAKSIYLDNMLYNLDFLPYISANNRRFDLVLTFLDWVGEAGNDRKVYFNRIRGKHCTASYVNFYSSALGGSLTAGHDNIYRYLVSLADKPDLNPICKEIFLELCDGSSNYQIKAKSLHYLLFELGLSPKGLELQMLERSIFCNKHPDIFLVLLDSADIRPFLNSLPVESVDICDVINDLYSSIECWDYPYPLDLSIGTLAIHYFLISEAYEPVWKCSLIMGDYSYLHIREFEPLIDGFKIWLLGYLRSKWRQRKNLFLLDFKIALNKIRTIRELQALPAQHLHKNYPGGEHYRYIISHYI